MDSKPPIKSTFSSSITENPRSGADRISQSSDSCRRSEHGDNPKDQNILERHVSIQCIDDSDLPIPLETEALEIRLIRNPDFKLPSFNNLKHLSIRQLACGIEEFKFPDSLSSLESLTIGAMVQSVKCIFPKSFPHLQRLVLGNEMTVPVNLPDTLELSNLTDLSIGWRWNWKIRSNETEKPLQIEVPSALRRLESFTVKYIDNDTSRQFVSSLTNLVNLSIGCFQNTQLMLTMTKLTSLTIESIFEGTINIDSLSALKKLFIGNIKNEGSLKSPQSFNELEILDFKDITSRNSITHTVQQDQCYQYGYDFRPRPKFICKFLCNLPKLKNLLIGDIHNYGTERSNLELELSCSLQNLEKLTIKTVNTSFTLRSLDSLVNFKTLEIGDIHSKSSLSLCGSYKQLTTLEFGNIKRGNKYIDTDVDLDGSFTNLRVLKFGHVEKYTKITWPKELTNLKELTISSIYCKHFKLPEFLPNLESLVIAYVHGKDIYIELPAQLPNLKELYINGVPATLFDKEGYKSFACSRYDFIANSFIARINKLLNNSSIQEL